MTQKLPPLLLLALLLPPLQSATSQTEPTAGDLYKNVQVLKNVPASTFMNTMFFQRYALGVSCNYCHVGSDWQKDDKPEKLKARKMQQMVLDINRTQFDGRMVVNCLTCHRGNVKPEHDIPASRISLEQMLGPKPTARPAAPAALPSADAVLTRYLAAIGGADALGKIRNRVVKGNLITAEGGIVPFEDTYTTAPGRSLSVRHFGGSLGDFATGYDGTNGWNCDNRGITDQRAQALAQLAMNAAFENRLNLPTLYTQLKVTGTERVGTSTATVLSATATLTGRTERLYFDVDTGLLLRRSIVTESLFGAFTTDTYYENYRTIDGVTLPIMVSEFTPDFGTVRKYTSVEHNADLNGVTFAKPTSRPSPP